MFFCLYQPLCSVFYTCSKNLVLVILVDTRGIVCSIQNQHLNSNRKHINAIDLCRPIVKETNVGLASIYRFHWQSMP